MLLAGAHSRRWLAAATPGLQSASRLVSSSSTSSSAKAAAAAAASPALKQQQQRAGFNAARRSLSSMMGGGTGGYDDLARGGGGSSSGDADFPVFGDDCLLKFRLSTYNPRPGNMYKPATARLMVEFTRKSAGGMYDWKGTKRLAMTPEEIGLLLDSGPTEELIFKRSGMQQPPQGGGSSPPKEIKFIPTSTGDWVIHLAVDDETYEVTVSRGRKACIKGLIQASLPALFGWHTKIPSAASGGGGGGYYGGGGGMGGGYHQGGGGGGGHHQGEGGIPF